MPTKLRPYQGECIDTLEESWKDINRPGVNIFTGGGKTAIMSKLNAAYAPTATRSNQHVLTLLHRDTLVEQTIARYKADVLPGTSIGIVKAKKNEVGAHTLVASIHSLRSAVRRKSLPPIGLCIVDEAHVSIADTYMALFEDIGAFNGGCKLAGFTATWTRSAGNLGDVWQDVVFTRTTKWGISNGYLVQPEAIQVGAGVDMSHARISALTGEYVDGDVELAIMSEEVLRTVVNGAKAHGPEMPSVLFGPTVDSVNYFLDGLAAAGFKTEAIFGTTSAEARRDIHRRHQLPKSDPNHVDIIGTCMALAEGWDAPYVSRLLLVRPVRHEGLFVQIVGRILRLWVGKTKALILDFVKATDDVKLRNSVSLVGNEDVCGKANTLDLDVDIDDSFEVIERKVRLAQHTLSVSLFPDSNVVWKQAHGIPYVSMGGEVIALVETRTGTNVGRFNGWTMDRRLNGAWLCEGIPASDALDMANNYAEDATTAHLASRSAAWRRNTPSPRMAATARARGIDPKGLTRGMMHDLLDAQQVQHQIEVLAKWKEALV